MSVNDLQELIDAFQNSDEDTTLTEIGNRMNGKKVKEFLDYSIQNDIQPALVLKAIFEATREQTKITTDVVIASISSIVNWKFRSDKSAEDFTSVLRKMTPQVLSPKTSFRMMCKIFEKVNSIDPTKNHATEIIEKGLSIIPPIFNNIWKENSEITVNEETLTCRDACTKWLHELFQMSINDIMIPSFIDTISDLPLDEEILSKFIDFIFSTISFSSLPQVASKIFQPLSKSKKLTIKCVRQLIMVAMKVEKMDDQATARGAQISMCGLIKTLSYVSFTNRLVLDALTTILTSRSELPRHFTPFIVSLSLYLNSRSKPKINEFLFNNFKQQLKDDEKRAHSRFLRHLYNLEPDYLSDLLVESVINEAIELAHVGLESNISFFVEFAFRLIDTAPVESKSRHSSKIRDSHSEFLPTAARQVEIGVMILDKCAKAFPTDAPTIFNQIVQRITTNTPNSVAMVRVLDSTEKPREAAEALVEVIKRMQYMDLMTVEQVMRFAVPKIVDNDELIDKVVISIRKAFCNRSERSKLNAVAAMFYLIQPRSEVTFTQTFVNHSVFGDRIAAAADEDLQHELFGLLQRALSQGPNVQADAFMFIPLLLKENPQLSDEAAQMFKDMLKDSMSGEEFPLTLKPGLPYMIQSISDSIDAMEGKGPWHELLDSLDNLASTISKVEYIVYTEEMHLLANPEPRDIALATLCVFFNYSVQRNPHEAIDIFNTYDHVVHKIQESDRIRKDNSLKSSYTFKFSINTDLLQTFLDVLTSGNDDYQKNYGVQLYILERIESVIKEVPYLRMEYRIKRLQLAMTLGKLVLDALDTVKWCDAPPGNRLPISLLEKLTDMFRRLFDFVFETYDMNTVMAFLANCSLMNEGDKITVAVITLFRHVKKFVADNKPKCVKHMCMVLEQIALFGETDDKLFNGVLKLTRKMVQKNKTTAGRFIRMSRFFSPDVRLRWLKEITEVVVSRLADEERDKSDALGELIKTVSELADDDNWAVANWITKVFLQDPAKAAEFSGRLDDYMLEVAEVTMELMAVDFRRMSVKYYEDTVKFLTFFAKAVTARLKKAEEHPDTATEKLGALLRFVTGEFGDAAAKFMLRQQGGGGENMAQNKFDTTHAPKLIYQLELVLTTTSKLIDKKLVDPDIRDSFCRIRTTDVRIRRTRDKKKKVEEEEPEPGPEPEQAEEEEQEPIDDAREEEEEDEEDSIANSQDE